MQRGEKRQPRPTILFILFILLDFLLFFSIPLHIKKLKKLLR